MTAFAVAVCLCWGVAIGQTSLTVNVSNSALATPLATMVGFSGIEASLDVLSATAADGSFEPRPSYARLMALLGSGVNHRIGHFWASANGVRPARVPSSWIEANTSTCARLAAALDAWGGSLSANIGPLDVSDATLVVDTATALTRCLAGRLASVELANEPDISSFKGNYSGYTSTLRMWLAGLAAAGLPRAVDAPVLAGAGWWPAMPAFLDAFSGSLVGFSQHRYALSACENRTNTPAQLMNASTAWDTAADAALLAAVAAARQPFVLGEGNSVACQGSAGVSDVFASALYAVDAMLSAAAVGITGYKWHGLGYAADAAFYQPIFYEVGQLRAPGWDSAQPRPLFLGLWAFAEAAPAGSAPLRVAATVAGGPSGGGSAVPARLLPAGALRLGTRVTVVALHKGDAGAAPVAVTVHPAAPCDEGAGAAAASLLRLLSGPGGLGARAGSSYANQTFDGTTDGAPAGARAAEAVPCRGGAYSFALPAASGAFLAYDDAPA